MASMELLEGKTKETQELPPISALDKIIVAFAGPLFSFLLALGFALVVMVVGRPVSETETTTVIGRVEKDGPADKAGLRPGDKILEVDGKPVSKFGGMGESVTWRVVRSEGATLPVKIMREGKELVVLTTPVKKPTKAWERKSLRQIEIEPAQSALIAEVVTNGPAARAGLRVDDQVLAVNGTRLYHYRGLSDYIEAHPGAKLALDCRRDGKPIAVTVTPEVPISPPREKPRLGIIWNGTGEYCLAHPGAVEQVAASVSAMVHTFEALFSRKSDIKLQHLGGAVKIISIYGMLFESEQGWRMALWFSVLINVNLALLNLLPFPVLDGGHITLALVESLRRKPVNGRVLNVVQTGCAVVLIGYMLYISFFDVQELPWKRGKEKDQPPMRFAPQPAPAPAK
jgi:regulator of sigma E protease